MTPQPGFPRARRVLRANAGLAISRTLIDDGAEIRSEIATYSIDVMLDAKIDRSRWLDVTYTTSEDIPRNEVRIIGQATYLENRREAVARVLGDIRRWFVDVWNTLAGRD